MSKFKKKALEAAFWTFLEAFLAALVPLIATINVTDINALETILASAFVGALASTVSIVKSNLVRNLGSEDSIFLSGE